MRVLGPPELVAAEKRRLLAAVCALLGGHPVDDDLESLGLLAGAGHN